MEEIRDIIEEQHDAAPSGSRAASPYVIPASIVIAGGLIAGAVLYSGGTAAPGPDAAGQQAAAGTAAVAGDLADDDAVLGNPDAPVTIVEFSDFQCPYCRRFWQETVPQLKSEYLATGKAKFIYRDFPLSQIHPGAMPAAEGAECAGDQDRYWDMHDVVFAEQARQGQGTVEFGVADIKKWAAEIGLNMPAFNECLDSGKYRQEVEKDYADGANAGVSGTPATFINGRLVTGAQPFAAFKQIIDEELSKAGQ